MLHAGQGNVGFPFGHIQSRELYQRLDEAGRHGDRGLEGLTRLVPPFQREEGNTGQIEASRVLRGRRRQLPVNLERLLRLAERIEGRR